VCSSDLSVKQHGQQAVVGNQAPNYRLHTLIQQLHVERHQLTLSWLRLTTVSFDILCLNLRINVQAAARLMELVSGKIHCRG